MMKSNTSTSSGSSAPREYELVNARCIDDEIDEEFHDPVSVVSAADDEEDGMWRVPYSSRSYSGRRRRRTILVTLVACTLVIVLVVAARSRSRGGNNASGQSAPPVSSSGDTAAAAANTTLPNTNQDRAVTPAPSFAKTSTPSTTPTTAPSPSPPVGTPSTTPTAAPSSPPVGTPSTTPTAAPPPPTASFNCIGDRIQNGVKLHPNHFLCDTHNRYRFGMDDTGSLVYADDAFHMTSILYNGTSDTVYFELHKDGLFAIKGTAYDSLLWILPCSDDVGFSPACLPTAHHGTYDCPYLHLHSGGTIVLNWIDFNDDWKERNILHMYDLPKCHDHFFCY